MLLIIYIPEREEEGATHPLSTLLGEEPPKLPATGSKDSQIYCRRVEEWESVDLSSYTCYRLAKLIPSPWTTTNLSLPTERGSRLERERVE